MWQAIYERVIQYASEAPLRAELDAARHTYLRLTGELFESDGNFERRMAAFLEWYTLERPLPDGTTPLIRFAHAHAGSLGAAELDAIGALQRSSPRLLALRGPHAQGIEVEDVMQRQHVVLPEAHQLVGLSRGDLLIVRRLDTDGQSLLTDGATFLPRAAAASVYRGAQRLIERRGPPAEHQQFLLALTYRANRAERYRHVDAAQIFADVKDADITRLVARPRSE